MKHLLLSSREDTAAVAAEHLRFWQGKYSIIPQPQSLNVYYMYHSFGCG
jgi:hypothetical protein